jgi:DNA-binding PadR family transcriptional regulator
VPPTRQPTTELPLAPAVYLILLALADGDAHGYRIRVAVRAHSKGLVTLDPGSLYRLIARLVVDGLIVEAPASARPVEDDERRRYYRLTATGRRVLAAETHRMADLVAMARAKVARRQT